VLHLVHCFDQRAVVQNVGQIFDQLGAIARSRLYVLGKDSLRFLDAVDDFLLGLVHTQNSTR
jgi:hypothetical protein